MVRMYIREFFSKKITINDHFIERFEKDVALLTDFGIKHKCRDKAVDGAVHVIKNLIDMSRCHDVTAFRATAKAILETHPDFTEDMAMFVVNNRAGLESDMKNSIVDEIHNLFKNKKKASVKDGLFTGFELFVEEDILSGGVLGWGKKRESKPAPTPAPTEETTKEKS